MSNDLKWMICSDLQMPYENIKYMNLWWQVFKWFKPDVVDVLGDWDDQNSCSRFSEGKPDEVNNKLSLNTGKIQDFFGKLRGNNLDRQIHAALGNHEIRVDEYIAKNAPALEGLITPETLWKTDTYGVELSYYQNPPVHRFGDIYVHHGLYAVKDAGASVKKMVDEFNVSCIVGHSHRLGTYNQTFELKNETLRGYEIGHMADIKSSGMNYTALKNWQAGFAVGIIEDGVYPHIQLIQISPENTCVVGTKLFKA